MTEIVDSPRQVAALMGISVSTVHRYLDDGDAKRRAGRPRVSGDALDQVELALAEHGSMRASARAKGMSVGGFSYRLKLARERSEKTSPESPTNREANTAAERRLTARRPRAV